VWSFNKGIILMTILILLALSNNIPTITSIEFDSYSSCLKALNSIIETEDKTKKILFKGRCVSK